MTFVVVVCSILLLYFNGDLQVKIEHEISLDNIIYD